MHNIKLARGFFRIWIAFSVLWVIGTAFVTHEIAEGLQPHDLSSNAHPYDDLIPSYAHCWDYRTKDGKRIQRKDIADTALLLIARCQAEADQKEAYWKGGLVAALVPFGLLVAGLVIAWIARGFIPRTA